MTRGRISKGAASRNALCSVVLAVDTCTDVLRTARFVPESRSLCDIDACHRLTRALIAGACCASHSIDNDSRCNIWHSARLHSDVAGGSGGSHNFIFDSTLRGTRQGMSCRARRFRIHVCKNLL